MSSTTSLPADAQEIAPTASGVRFTVASRPQVRMAYVGTVSNLAGATSFAPIALPATGWVRKVSLFFTVAYTAGSAAATVGGDAPWNVASLISLTDATGQMITQPISGYSLYLVNKYSPVAGQETFLGYSPQTGPEYTYNATGGTTGTATFRLDIDLEQDYSTGYGCIPNLDSNASLVLNVNLAAASTLFNGTGPTASNVTLRVEQHYWAPVAGTMGGQPVSTMPPGAGDYIETRFETTTLNAGSENLYPFAGAKGGLVKSLILISRNGSTRTDLANGSPLGLTYDNVPIEEGYPVEAHVDRIRRRFGYIGTDISTPYNALTAGVVPGRDRGVYVWNFDLENRNRDAWLATRVGSLLQARVTPAAGATTLEVITQIMQVRDAAAFYAKV